MNRQQPVKKKTKSEWIYDTLYQKIISGEIPPNTKLNVKTLAQEFGTSEIPVREALQRLNSEDVLGYESYVGYVVPSFSEERLFWVWEVKVDLEILAGRRAAEQCTESDLALLWENIREAEEILKTNDFSEFKKNNKAFHMTLSGFSRNPFLVQMILNLWDRTEKIRGPFVFSAEHIGNSIEEHKRLIAALERHDAEGVQAIIHSQRTHNWDNFIQVYRNMRSILGNSN